MNLGIPFEPPEGEEPTLEWLYGIDLIRVGIHDMDYEENIREHVQVRLFPKSLMKSRTGSNEGIFPKKMLLTPR